MIQFCTCSGGPASALEQTRKREVPLSCKNCGGKSLVDGRGALSGSMLSTVGIELTRVIDPDLTWKTASKSNKRGARRARASLTVGHKKKHVSGSLKRGDDPIDTDLKGVEDMPVSESEKLGVSILGRRFSDIVESVPIKKRKFLLVRSPSPPPKMPSPRLEESECLLKNQSASNAKKSALMSNAERRVNKIKKVSMAEMGDAENAELIGYENNSEGITKLGDNADFSGISILAAAACSSNICADASNAEEGSFRDLQNSELSSVREESCEKYLPSDARIPLGKTDLDISAEIPVRRTTLSMGTNNGHKRFSDGKNGVMITSSLSPEKSTDISVDLSIKENGTLGTCQSSLRDDRSHWDLNTMMDAWESPCDDSIVKAKPNLVFGIHNDDMLDAKLGSPKHHQLQMELGDTEDASEMTVQEKLGRTGLNTVRDDACSFACTATDGMCDKNGESCPSAPGIHEPIEKQQQLKASAGADKITCSPEKVLSCESAPDGMDATKETKHNKDQSSFKGENIVSIPAERSPEMGGDGSSPNAYAAEENADVQCTSNVVASKDETLSFSMVASGVMSGDHTAHLSKSPPGAVHINSNTMSEDETTSGVGGLSGDQCITDSPTGKTIHPSSPQIEKPSCEFADSSTIACDAQPSTTMLVDGNDSKMMDGNSMVSQVVETKPLHGAATCNAMDQATDTDVVMGSCHPESDACETLNCEEPSAANPCFSQDTLFADSKTEDHEISFVAEGKVSVPKMDVPVVVKDSVHKSANEMLEITEAQSLVGSLVSVHAQRANEGDHVNISGSVALEDSFDGNYSDGSQNDPDQTVAAEKVSELLADDDSQYEDGEFREAFVHSWEDAGEEGEAEHVDYGSDNIDIDTFEVAAEYGASAPLQCENVEYKEEASSELDRVCQEVDLVVEKNDQETNHNHLSSRRASLKTQVSAIDSGKKRTFMRKVPGSRFTRKDGDEMLETNGKIVADLGPSSENVIGVDEFGNKGDGALESCHSALLRTKSTGWDQLPEVCKSSREAATDVGDCNIERNLAGALLDSSDTGESLRRVVGSMSNRELSSRIEKPKSSDVPFRKDKIHVQGSRSHDIDDSNLRGERDTGLGRSIGRGGSSGHMRGRGRGGDHWLDSSGGNWAHKRHNSPGYYDSGDFAGPGPKNAAAAAAAKLESSGFLVARDGTIVKSGTMGPGRVHRRLANASSQSTHHSLTGRGSPTDRDGALRFGMPVRHVPIREMSPDRSISAGRGRSGRYGPRVFASGHRERYNGHMPDDDLDSSLPIQHPLVRRERSFSPVPRRAFQLSRSRTKSRSRSRTRSPHMWTSPRGRSGGGINGGSSFRRHSRSPPNFRSEVRMERMRSPDRRPRFAAHMVGFVSASRSHGSPPHGSRWVDDRKDAPDHFREHDYKRSSASERSPPGGVLTRSHRFDIMASPGRLKPDEFYRPTHSARFPGFVGVGRGPRHDGSDDDRRKHGERYGMIHSVRHYDIDGDVKRFRYDVGDGFRANQSRTKSASDFHGRGSPPRDYARDIDSRLGNAPRRTREEKGHFRYDRDGKQTDSFKTFGIRESDEDATPRRRRPS